MSYLYKYRSSLLVTLIFTIFTLISFNMYKVNALDDDINNHILAGDMFGVPVELKAHGIKPLYYGDGQAGWDGQFYYYMSNDILAIKDTANHIDSPSYRYQRIGLSLYNAIISKLFGASWVSPTFFFVNYFCLILIATFVGARLLIRFGLSPFFILLWSLSVGTQITLFNALPDAAADAFLIIALGLLINKRIAWSIIPFVLSCLSREVYVLFPSFIAFFYFLKLTVTEESMGISGFRRGLEHFFFRSNFYLLLLPGVAAVCWRFYVTNHFGVTPASQAHGILGLPFVSWFEYLLSELSGNHKLVGGGIFAYAEAGSLLLFFLTLSAAFWSAWRVVKSRFLLASPELGGVALASLCLAVLYICFGPIVIMHYTGYLKALAVFFFLIPLLLSSVTVTRFEKVSIYGLLMISLLFTTLYNMKARILPYSSVGDEQITKISEISDRPRIECFGKYDAKIKINSISLKKVSVMSHLFGAKDKIIIDLDLTNTGEHPFFSTRNFGSVFMSYHWVSSEGLIIKDGVRSVIPGGLLPGQTKRVTVLSNLPTNIDAVLVLSPVQEGCAWFYQGNSSISSGIKFNMKL